MKGVIVVELRCVFVSLCGIWLHAWMVLVFGMRVHCVHLAKKEKKKKRRRSGRIMWWGGWVYAPRSFYIYIITFFYSPLILLFLSFYLLSQQQSSLPPSRPLPTLLGRREHFMKWLIASHTYTRCGHGVWSCKAILCLLSKRRAKYDQVLSMV